MIKKTIRTITLTVAMMLTVSAFAPISKADAANVTGTVTVTSLNVRSGASTSYSVLGKISKGEKVEILSSRDGWYKIEYGDNKTGWSCDDYISKNTTSGTVTTTSLNVRSGASTSYSILGKLGKDEKVEILSTNNGWHEIQYSQNNTGWVSTDYITTTSDNASKDVAKTLNVKAYAYTGDGITATGTVPKYGTIAVDPSVIPYGTKVYIKELDKVFTAEDCGGAIKGNTIDIFMPTEKNCNDWGIKNITIEILK